MSYERITYQNFSFKKPIPLKKGYRKIKKRVNYRYDALNRITSAIGANTSNYNLNSVTYDKMGNILSLSRNGWQNTSTFTNKDVLTYSYYNSNVSNKLQKVLDNGNDNYGFKDGVNLTTEYTYDANANLITDANKGITSILYNHLNLPTEIKFNNNNDKKINYTYSADGAKLRKVVNDGGAITTLDYADNGAVYENNTLQFIPHAEGYITPDGSSWRYVYQYRDHIDNIRLSYSDGDGNGTISQSEIIQENNYQPFGLKMRGFNNNTNSLGNSMAERYMFGGKEFDDSFNETLNTYDFGARNYDPALGRWMNVDPLAHIREWVSPYNFVQNNPINRVDPTGALDNPIYGTDGEFLGTDDRGLQGDAIAMNKKAFKQGMSHNEAKAFDNGTTSMSDGAKSKMNTHFSGLKDRPDWDGKLTFSEVTKWSNQGSGNSLFVDGRKINLSPFTVTDVENAAKNNDGYIDFFDDWKGDLNTGRVYGNIKVTLKNKSSGGVILGVDGLLDIHNFRDGSAAERTNDLLYPGIPADFNIYCAPCNSKVEKK